MFVLVAAAATYWRYREMRAAIVADGTTLHRVLSQRVDQHDAHMTGLSALAQAADPPPVDAIQQVTASILKFYPRIMAIDIADLADEQRPPLLGAGLPLDTVFSAMRRSNALLTVVPVEGAERVMLVKRVPRTGASQYLIILLIDLRKLIETDRFGPELGPAQLSLEGKPLLSASPGFDQTPVAFEAILASRTQPLMLRIASPIRIAALFPWGILMLVALGLALGAFIVDRLVAARVAAKEAGARAMLAAQDARLAHASRVNAMGELASGIAHELTQPLTAILSQCQAGQRLAQRAELDRPALHAAFAASARNAKRAGDILGKLRSWVTKGQPVVEPVDLAGLIGDVVQLTAAEALAHAARIEFNPPRYAVVVRADRVQLEQVVFNLARNAIEATKFGLHPARISITLTGSGQVAEISVRDNGPGFEPEALSRVFEPFFTTKLDGMGLGLSLCMTLVERYGGTILAQNSPDGGAELVVRLPLMVRDAGIAHSEAAE